MKIGIVTQAFTRNSGVGNNALCCGRELENLGHDVSIITAHFTGENDDRGMRVIRIGQDVRVPSNGAFSNFTVGLNLSERLEDVFKKEKFDIINIHSPLEPSLPLLALRQAPHPVVGTFHTYSESTLAWEAYHPYAKKWMKKLDGHIAVSKAAAGFFNQFANYDFEIIPNGVDTKRFDPQNSSIKKFDDKTFNILFVGRMDPRKGLKYLFEALAIIYGHREKVRLIVVGGGVMKDYYKRYLLPELEDKVFFEGYVSDEVLPGYYTTADVYVSPATGQESFGIVLLEAMASGVPIVASDIKGYHSAVSTKEGIFVPPKSPVALAKAIIKLMDHPRKAKELGQAGREKAEKFAWPKVAKQAEAFFKKVIAQKK